MVRERHTKRHKSVNQPHRAIKFSPDEKAAATSNLKFTKRNYNEAVLIREATQEQYNNFLSFEEDLILLNLWQNSLDRFY